MPPEKNKEDLDTENTKENTIYNSKNGMLTRIWGPPLWHYLHTMSFNYPINPTIEDKQHYSDFILNLQYVLPCGKCRENLKKNFRKLPLQKKHMESRESFSRYVYQLHETVNTMLNKKSGLTYDTVRDSYESFRANCSNKKETKIKETGCIEPIYRIKSRCMMTIVPDTSKIKKQQSLKINKKCKCLENKI